MTRFQNFPHQMFRLQVLQLDLATESLCKTQSEFSNALIVFRQTKGNHGFIQTLKQRLTEIIPAKQAQVKEVRAKHGSKKLGETTVDMVFLFNEGLWWYERYQGPDLGNFCFGF